MKYKWVESKPGQFIRTLRLAPVSHQKYKTFGCSDSDEVVLLSFFPGYFPPTLPFFPPSWKPVLQAVSWQTPLPP